MLGACKKPTPPFKTSILSNVPLASPERYAFNRAFCATNWLVLKGALSVLAGSRTSGTLWKIRRLPIICLIWPLKTTLDCKLGDKTVKLGEAGFPPLINSESDPNCSVFCN